MMKRFSPFLLLMAISVGHVCALWKVGVGWARPVFAEQRRMVYTHVTAGADGRCYAKSIPKSSGSTWLDQAGKTRVYRVRDDNDMLVDEYDWYARDLFVQCAGVGTGTDTIKIAIVRVLGWDDGWRNADKSNADKSNADKSLGRMALGFYVGGQERHTWSIGDVLKILIQRNSEQSFADRGLSGMDSHLTGFVRHEGEWLFRLALSDGQKLLFDPATGMLWSGNVLQDSNAVLNKKASD